MTYKADVIWSNSSFDQIADALAEKDFCVVDDFLNHDEVNNLKNIMDYYRSEDNFHKAGIGKLHHFQVDKNIRGDRIKWISKEQALEPTAMFLQKIEILMQYLNRLLFLSLKDYETHFAIYPPQTFYEKHIDQFQISGSRKISFAFYLNENWQHNHGGELCIHTQSEAIKIPPIAGRLAIFRSDIVEHEVCVTNVSRYSITGWMLDRPIDLPFV